MSTTENPKVNSLLNSIICGDSLEIIKSIPDATIDIVLTSPPYNFEMEYDTHNDSQSVESYMSVLIEILTECHRVLKDGGRMIINVQPNYKLKSPTHHIITNLMTEMGMIWRGEIVWLKNHLSKLTAWGSWKSPSCPYLSYPFEFIEVYSKATLKHPGKSEDIDITKEEFINFVNGHWTMTPETQMKKFNHPAMFPEELVERCLKLFSFKNDVVLDPFNGAGTTTKVCSDLGRQYIGIDISPEYCETATNRIN